MMMMMMMMKVRDIKRSWPSVQLKNGAFLSFRAMFTIEH